MSLTSLVFVPRCPACGELLPYGYTDVLCPFCLDKWENEKQLLCDNCRHIFAECRCPIPLSADAGIDLSVFVAPYNPSLAPVTARLIYAIKNRRLPLLTNMIAGSMAQALRAAIPDLSGAVAVPVPRRPSVRRVTGTDQARELASALAKHTGISYCAPLQRTGRHFQKRLDAAARAIAAAESYGIDMRKAEAIRGATVILTDDIITSGATVRTCASLLREAGAARIICAAFARSSR